MTESALLASLIMDKFHAAQRKPLSGPRKRRARATKGKGKKGKGRGKKGKKGKSYKLVTLPSGLMAKVAKRGYMQNANGRFVKISRASLAALRAQDGYDLGATNPEDPFSSFRRDGVPNVE